MKRQAKRILVLFFGWFLVLLGLIGFVTPFLQGIILLMLGLYILSFESKYLGEILEKLKERFPHFAKFQASMEAAYKRAFGKNGNANSNNAAVLPPETQKGPKKSDNDTKRREGV